MKKMVGRLSIFFLAFMIVSVMTINVSANTATSGTRTFETIEAAESWKAQIEAAYEDINNSEDEEYTLFWTGPDPVITGYQQEPDGEPVPSGPETVVTFGPFATMEEAEAALLAEMANDPSSTLHSVNFSGIVSNETDTFEEANSDNVEVITDDTDQGVSLFTLTNPNETPETGYTFTKTVQDYQQNYVDVAVYGYEISYSTQFEFDFNAQPPEFDPALPLEPAVPNVPLNPDTPEVPDGHDSPVAPDNGSEGENGKPAGNNSAALTGTVLTADADQTEDVTVIQDARPQTDDTANPNTLVLVLVASAMAAALLAFSRRSSKA